jgi:serine/threonine protein kinase
MCGTSEYLAPEIILSSGGHSFGVDWYALGIVIYELLVGHTPFAGTNDQNHPSQIYIRILHAPISWPSSNQG